MSKNLPCIAARVLALAWGGFWSYFVVASELAETASLLQKAFVCLIGVGFFLGSAALPLLCRRRGGNLLLLEGIILGIANFTYLHNPWRLFLLLTLAAPPLLAGLVLLTIRPRR